MCSFWIVYPAKQLQQIVERNERHLREKTDLKFTQKNFCNDVLMGYSQKQSTDMNKLPSVYGNKVGQLNFKMRFL